MAFKTRKCPACGKTKNYRTDVKTCGCAGTNPQLHKTAPPHIRMAFLDIETMPSIGYVWGKWEQDILDFIEEGYVFSYGIKIVGKRGVKIRALSDYPDTWSKSQKDETALLLELRQDLANVDVVIAHNGDKFDLPTVMSRLVVLGQAPLRPFRTIDTLKWARKDFNFKSNKLDDLCRELGIGRKLPHTGFHLWKRCMAGDMAAIRMMKRYNRHDVLLLEELYYRFLPFTTSPPNVNLGSTRCTRCGSSNYDVDGTRYTAARKKGQLHCLNCGGWFFGSAKGVTDAE